MEVKGVLFMVLILAIFLIFLTNVSSEIGIGDFYDENGSLMNTTANQTDSNPINLTILSPINTVYSKNQILLEIKTDKIVDQLSFIDYSDKIKRPRILCTNCDYYSKNWSFGDKKHMLLFRAFENGDLDMKQINFTVDSNPPKIHSIKPRTNISIGNESIFEIKYSENFISNISLKYGVLGNESVQVLDCPSGKNMLCQTKIANLSMYDSQQIIYYFEIVDDIGTTVTSKKQIITVDTTAPILIGFESQKDRNSVAFSFDVVERNFAKIVYYDRANVKTTKPSTLCTSLRSGTCYTKKTFRKGYHDLDIFVLDKAGNSDNMNLNFTIP